MGPRPLALPGDHRVGGPAGADEVGVLLLPRFQEARNCLAPATPPGPACTRLGDRAQRPGKPHLGQGPWPLLQLAVLPGSTHRPAPLSRLRLLSASVFEAWFEESRMANIGLVGCCRRKLSHAAPARDLY